MFATSGKEKLNPESTKHEHLAAAELKKRSCTTKKRSYRTMNFN
jgi:hypothetical protein